jgi:hypothetical protein
MDKSICEEKKSICEERDAGNFLPTHNLNLCTKVGREVVCYIGCEMTGV